MIKVTIAIPTYNHSEYLDKCLNSIFRQDYPLTKYEVIVVDDSSTDNTPEVLKKYIQKYNNIQIVRNKKNRGPYYSRNRCVDLSKGELIAFLDSDCIVPAEWLTKIGKKFSNPCITCVQGTQKCGGKWGKSAVEGEKYLKILKSFGSIDTKNFIIRRDIISKYRFDDNTYSLGDFDMGLRLKNDNIIYYDSDIVVTHVCNDFKEVISRGKRVGKGAAFIYKKYGKIIKPIFKFPSPIIFTYYFLLFFLYLLKYRSFRGALAKSTSYYFMAIYFRKNIRK